MIQVGNFYVVSHTRAKCCTCFYMYSYVFCIPAISSKTFCSMPGGTLEGRTCITSFLLRPDVKQKKKCQVGDLLKPHWAVFLDPSLSSHVCFISGAPVGKLSANQENFTHLASSPKNEDLQIDELREEHSSLQGTLERKRLATREARHELNEAEHQSQKAATFLTQVSASFDPSIRKLRRACNKEMQSSQNKQSEANDIERLELYQQESTELRQALRDACNKLQGEANPKGDAKQVFWRQGIVELVGQVMMLLSSVKDLDTQINREEMTIEEALNEREPEIMEDLQSVAGW